MNVDADFHNRVQKIVEADPRYQLAAYEFVCSAVTYTGQKLRAEGAAAERLHISGRQLLDGIRELALQEFGPLALDVLEEWGVKCTEDFGAVVFNLVEHNLLGASDDDSPEDFANGYDFIGAFLKPFVEVGEFPADLPTID